jgi:hypothetical protein
LKSDTDRQDFVKMRQKRDATLAIKKLILPSIQINMDAGRFQNQKVMVCGI